eukprot:CAMPEP_0182427586 /NCGR_PEP_ID=MMETSP1167-20130531/18794_1 /TAXON_ID=2988 /ORGANISM="Mallomonas Sp, Strain CCMP3275" /LENGTH=152 /DNA_ID=CAMNT_0024609921 /DNA_START=98 /DNA_END=552 /DNA_ORIENTATION=+
MEFAALNENSGSTKRIVIVGSGIAGLAAAEEFERLGINDFVILEARNRYGGRVWDLEDSKISLGANWIHGLLPSNPMTELVKKQGLLLHPTSPDDNPGDDTILVDLGRESDMGNKYDSLSSSSSRLQQEAINEKLENQSKEVSVISNEVYSS